MKVESMEPVPEPFSRDCPDLHLRADGETSLSLWWTEVPSVEGEKTACLGHFSAKSREQAVELLGVACDELRSRGRTKIVGPMNGNTWRSYRFVCGGSTEPPFFMEPHHPSFYPEAFLDAGFTEDARYSSSRVSLEGRRGRNLVRVEERLAERGVSIRAIQVDDFESELELLYDLSTVAFQENYLYTPIPQEGFCALYQPVRALVDPEFVLLAEVEGRAVSFVFALPDLAEVRRTGETKTLIAKTLATDPGWRHLGVGSVLLERVQKSAKERGFQSVIHALQHETNLSRKITSRQDGVILREYALYSREL